VTFNITSALLEHLFNPTSGPSQAHLILQKDALIATSEYGAAETFKSLMLQPLYQIDLTHSFAKSDFTPQPGVETGLFAFIKRSEPLIQSVQYELYKDFLAFVSKDRVGEGVWSRLFSKPQLQKLTDQAALIYGRGLKSQSAAAMVAAFQLFVTANRPKYDLVKGAMSSLREEQNRREQINRAGGHRRDPRRDNRPDPRRKPPR
jgi:16S rRNA A1518/A1519 N6-dimethyltransferase RsmA/KsgA/DIM1 with predicted DNA glycosylase/AP lyase activity